MRVAVLGKGAREHALTWKLNEEGVTLFSLPGNAGTALMSERIGIELEKENFFKIKEALKEKKVELVVVGPEAPLVSGIVDYLESEGFMVFGPKKDAARLEGSKVFAKEFACRHKIPVPHFEVFDEAKNAYKTLQSCSYPIVIKADGLCAGKGTFICKERKEAFDAVEKIMEERIFGESGEHILIEEFIDGREVSILIFLEGERFYPMPPCRDYKRLFDEDAGPNTGGMGSYAPVPWVDETLWECIKEKTILPTIKGLKKEGIYYRGVLYLGLMIKDGVPYLLEYNVRWGDPEAQAIIPLMDTSLLDATLSLIEGRALDIKWKKKACVCIVLASGEYPFGYKKGLRINGLKEAEREAFVFHAGTETEGDDIITAGGRVLSVVGMGEDLSSARKSAYNACRLIDFSGMHYRNDIAKEAE